MLIKVIFYRLDFFFFQAEDLSSLPVCDKNLPTLSQVKLRNKYLTSKAAGECASLMISKLPHERWKVLSEAFKTSLRAEITSSFIFPPCIY